jgi:predicted AlkP superfamily phosphohydrolase/phosphomutase
MSASPCKVLVLGLDGATFDLMLPWIDEGRLPALAGLVRGGAWSRLQSTVPPITPCAWSSFMTGQDPGKHGLFDFVEPLPGGAGFRFTNASCRRGETLWGYLSRHGRKVGVLNVPMTYPPERVNGYLLSGLDTPSERSPFAFPAEVRQELEAQGIHYRIDVQHLGNMTSDARRDHHLQELHEVEGVRTRALQYLQKRYPADFRMLVYSATDQVQHHFWHYMDPGHDKHDARGAERYRDAIRDVYVHLDGLITSVLKEVDEDTVVVLMSDHGFGPTSNVRLRLNQALERAGLLKFADEGKRGKTVRSLVGWADRILRSNLSNGAKRMLASLFPKLRVWFETRSDAQIDWTKTVAYANEAFRANPAVWINHRGRRPDAPVAEGAPLEEALRVTEEFLKGLKDPQTGKPAIRNVYRARDLYEGRTLAKAPDLILSWWEDHFLLERSTPGGPAELDVERSKTPIRGGVEFAGSHRPDGVFALAGGPVRKGFAFDGARIIDVAPTLLYLMGLPVPSSMDGRVLVEALDPDFVAARPPEHGGGAPAAPVAPARNGTYTEEEAGIIEQRLAELGYLE